MEHPVFIGRQREQDLLSREFLKTLSGQTHVGLIAGEPGIGKTRLLTQFAEGAEKDGTLILQGLSSETEGMPPYLPFLEALGSYIRAAPLALLRKQIEAQAPALAPLFPEITQRLGNLAAAYALPAEQARFRLYEAIALFFSNLCESQPVLLLLDDLQWADSASLDLLGYLVRHQPHLRLFVLGGMRSGEETRADLAHLLVELDRLRRLTLIELRPLSAEAIADLARHSLGAPLDTESAQTLYARSEGNPFFAEELLRGWQETGRLRRLPTTWQLDSPGEGEFPPSILRAIEQRLARLPTQTVERLRSAAIIGRYFEIRLLAEIAGQETDAVEAQLQPAVRARLIRAEEDGFVFNHDTIRQALYQQVTSSRRQRLHGFIGHALEQRPQRHDVHQLSDLAFHFTRSGDRERGIRYAEQAAEEALRAYAPREALRHYRAALELVEQIEGLGLPSPTARGEALLGLGEAALQSGEQAEAARAFESALEWFRRNGEQASAARGAYGLGRARWQSGEVAQAEAAFRLALELLGEEAGVEASHIHADLANLLVLSRHQYDEGMTHAQRALDIARRLGDEPLSAAALRTLGNLYVRANRLSEGVARLDNALELAVKSDNPAEAAEVCTGLLIAVAWNCNFQRAREAALQLIHFAERCQTRHYLRHVYSLLAILEAAQGNLEKSPAWLERAEAIVASLADPEPLAFLHYSRAFLAWISGDYAAMLAQVSQTVQILRASDADALIWYLGLEAFASVLCGQRSAGQVLRDELESLLRALPDEAFPASEALSHLALFALASGEHDRLPGLYAKLLPFRGQYHDALTDRLLGAIEIIREEWDQARDSLDTAEAIARRENLRWELAHTLVSRADLELARGGAGSATRARAFLAEARDLFKSFGNDAEERRIRARLRDLPPQPGGKPSQPAPAGLSRRELDVLRLLAQGKTNREIAETLALSEKTVANHVTMIFNKIGVENRAAAAAFAVKEGVA